MRILFGLLLFVSFSAQATSPFMSVKERLRLSLWVEGVDEKPLPKKTSNDKKPLPEELERALRKI